MRNPPDRSPPTSRRLARPRAALLTAALVLLATPALAHTEVGVAVASV